MDTKGGKRWRGGGGGGMNWAIGIDMYTLMCIKWMTNKNLLFIKKNQQWKIKKLNCKKKKKKEMSGHVPERRGSPSPDVLEVQSTDYGCTYLGPARHLAWIGEYLVKSEFLLNV